MSKRGLSGLSLKFLPVLTAFLFVCGCVSVPVNRLPDPEPTARLRVMVLPVTGPMIRGNWATSEEEWARRAYINMRGFLKETGIYEIIPKSDLERAIGKRRIYSWEWKQGDWSLARKVGEAVHADYIFIAEREDAGLLYYRMILINRETGRQYTAGGNAAKQHDWVTTSAAAGVVVKDSYREIFRIAKGDLFETALRKGRAIQDQPAAPAEPGPSVVKPAPAKPASVPEIRKPAQARKNLPEEKARLIVYDFKADKHMEVVSLILSEALREELFSLGPFILVSRENINQVVDEMKLQHSGLVDEKQAVRIGDWLAANEMVTGNLAALGQVYVLSAKRTDIGTLKALGMVSLKCRVGKEEDLLAGIPEIARKLAGSR
jgi:hypothetical protein